MTYKIKAPREDYTREVAGVQFVRGEATTENEWAAQWFSGRDGFTVEPVKRARKKGDDGAGDTD